MSKQLKETVKKLDLVEMKKLKISEPTNTDQMLAQMANTAFTGRSLGEAVDVTGWLGGYNFQWAWSSGWAAGTAIAERT